MIQEHEQFLVFDTASITTTGMEEVRHTFQANMSLNSASTAELLFLGLQ